MKNHSCATFEAKPVSTGPQPINWPLTHLNWPVARLNWPLTRLNWPLTHLNWPRTRLNWPLTRLNWLLTRLTLTRLNWPLTRLNWPLTRLNWPQTRINWPLTRLDWPRDAVLQLSCFIKSKHHPLDVLLEEIFCICTQKHTISRLPGRLARVTEASFSQKNDWTKHIRPWMPKRPKVTKFERKSRHANILQKPYKIHAIWKMSKTRGIQSLPPPQVAAVSSLTTRVAF